MSGIAKHKQAPPYAQQSVAHWCCQPKAPGTIASPDHSTYMVSITWHTRNTWEYTGKKGGFGRKGYVACTGGYECIMHNACIGGLGNTSSLPIVMVNVVFETTPFWALGVYGRILKAPIPQYTAVYSGVYGRILGVYGRILGVFVCTMWLFQVEKFHCCAFCAHLVACFAFAQQLHTT